MRCVLVTALVLVVAVARGADDTPKASGTLDGKVVEFPNKTTEEGAKVVIGLLMSCTSGDKGYSMEDLKKAQKGDHVRLVLATPRALTVPVLGERVELSEVVVTLPLSTGVIWARAGDKVMRLSKYQFRKEAAVNAWITTARAAKPGK